MFGTNEIVGKKFFAEAPQNSLFVTSIFFTIQGEGPYAGRPALFVRLAKCNLACQFCDTFFDQGDWLTYQQIKEKADAAIDKYWVDQGKPVPDWASCDTWCSTIEHPGVVLVITGGEPLLQSNLTAFLERQHMTYAEVQIETNGLLNTYIPSGVTIVCSPKCAEKNGVALKYLKPNLDLLAQVSCLKFVMSADLDSPYSEVPQWAIDWLREGSEASARHAPREIYVSPMNIYNDVPQQAKVARLTNKDGKLSLPERSTVDEVISFWTPGLLNLEQNRINHEYTARYALNNGFKLNLQLHLYASMA